MSDKEFNLILVLIVAIAVFTTTAVVAVQDAKAQCYKSAATNQQLKCE